jgi:hypothetical protein
MLGLAADFLGWAFGGSFWVRFGVVLVLMVMTPFR